MSKMDGLRAMREARYAEAAARARQGTPPARVTATRPTAVTPAVRESATAEAEPAAEGLCGHRNMSGRTCTREHGHAAKSHRYS
jgi:hypothetical protein